MHSILFCFFNFDMGMNNYLHVKLIKLRKVKVEVEKISNYVFNTRKRSWFNTYTSWRRKGENKLQKLSIFISLISRETPNNVERDTQTLLNLKNMQKMIKPGNKRNKSGSMTYFFNSVQSGLKFLKSFKIGRISIYLGHPIK